MLIGRSLILGQKQWESGQMCYFCEKISQYGPPEFKR